MKEKFSYYISIYHRFGYRAVLFLFLRKLLGNGFNPQILLGLKHPLHLSNDGPDIMTMFQIFLANEYQVNFNQSPTFIVDCGANIGLSAVYFAHHYPEATIIAIEPDTQNFSVLQQNAGYYINIKCMHKAVWSRNTAMCLIDPGFGNWGMQTAEATAYSGEEEQLHAITIDSVMQQFNQEHIDLLKVDIEGAEKELFGESSRSWLPRVKVLAIELHDSIDPGISAVFFNSIAHLPSEVRESGENLIVYFKN